MRIILVLFCSFALACIAGAQETKKKSKSASKPMRPAPAHHTESRQVSPGTKPAFEQAKVPQHYAQPNARPSWISQPGGHRPSAAPAATFNEPVQPPEPGKPSQPAEVAPPAQRAPTQQQLDEANARAQGFRSAEQYRKWKETGQLQGLENVASTGTVGVSGADTSQANKVTTTNVPSNAVSLRTQHFNLLSKIEPGVPVVTFQQNGRIKNCQNWQGKDYTVFRNYRACWHDRVWWTRNHARIVFVFGGWYYWNAHYWFPAWGYDSVGSYVYDGPIYAYNNLPPDQAVANVQATLQTLGYYHGPVNGLLGPLTREALASYQRDHGLYTTSAIDEPTLASLGMT